MITLGDPQSAVIRKQTNQRAQSLAVSVSFPVSKARALLYLQVALIAQSWPFGSFGRPRIKSIVMVSNGTAGVMIGCRVP